MAAERLVAAVARGVTMAGGAIRAARARMNFAQSADPGEQLGQGNGVERLDGSGQLGHSCART
jgi:hypothetical protein